MTEKFREKLSYLNDDVDDRSMVSQLRSVSPHAGSRSPRRSSRSPRPHNTADSNAVRDSRPDIAAWPAPPSTPGANGQNNNGTQDTSVMEESGKLLTMIKVAAATGPGAPRGRESELKKKIQTLEDTVAEYERQKYNVMGTFSEYRERVAERERKLEAEYSSKIIALSEEVLGAKKDFEARMKSFQALQDKFEREKEQALEKLRQEHQKEIQLLEQRFSESQLLNLEQKYMIEIQRLEEERKSLKAEKERLGETFEMKLRRAQSLYETELSAAKMLYSKELEALRDHEEALKEELLARQDEFHDRLQELQNQSKRSREELACCKNEVSALEKKLQMKEAEVQAISKELEEAKNETNDSLKKLSEVEVELKKTRQQYVEQEEELQRKASLLNIVEVAKAKLEAVIKDLQNEVKALKNKVEFLERERENLQSQSESQTQLQTSQINALEAVLESVTKEKETEKENYEKLLEQEREQAEGREYAMKKEFTSKLNELEEQYTSLKEQLEQSAKEDTNHELKHELDSLRSDNANLIDEVAEMKSKLRKAYKEGRSNEEAMELREEIAEYQEEICRLKAELDKTTQTMQSRDSEIVGLKEQLEQENELADDQLDVIRDEIREEIRRRDQGAATRIAESDKEREVNQKLADQYLERAEQVENEKKKLEEVVAAMQQEMRKSEEEFKRKLESQKTELTRLSSNLDQQTKTIVGLEENKKNSDDLLEKTVADRMQSEVDKVKEQYAQKLEDAQQQADKKHSFLLEEIKALNMASDEKTGQIEHLHERVKTLTEEVDNIRTELENKTEELKRFSSKTDEYLRKREQQQGLAFEKKIISLNKEHEKTIELLRQHEQELANELHILKAAQSAKPEVSEIEVQTEDLEKPKALIDLAKQKELNGKIEELEAALSEKTIIIKELQEELAKHLAAEEDESPDRKKLSSSGEHLAVGQRTTSRLQILMNQISEKRDKSKSKSAEQSEPAEKSKKSAKETKSTADKPAPIQRAKSPSLLTRLRDRSPAKAKSPALEASASHSGSKNLLSPSDAERPTNLDERRRSSPSRPLFSRSKKESTSTSATVLTVDKSEKRPAWKF
uniref:FAM184 domain-containing protein n=1 Tax=Steinernema glaseri TaxID=37863 RepID=A0A1I7ZUV7_9BILA